MNVDEYARFGREVYGTYRSEGIGPVMGKFAAGAGLDQDPPQPPVDPIPEMAEAMDRMQGNRHLLSADSRKGRPGFERPANKSPDRDNG